MVEVFALVVHDAVIVVVATLDPLAVPSAAVADAAAATAAAAAAAAAAAGMWPMPMLGVPADECDGAFRRGGGVGGVNCRSIPSWRLHERATRTGSRAGGEKGEKTSKKVALSTLVHVRVTGQRTRFRMPRDKLKGSEMKLSLCLPEIVIRFKINAINYISNKFYKLYNYIYLHWYIYMCMYIYLFFSAKCHISHHNETCTCLRRICYYQRKAWRLLSQHFSWVAYKFIRVCNKVNFI